MKQVGIRIKIIRLTNGLSQECIAFKLGITQQAYSKIEKGQTDIRVSQLRQIAAVLDVSVIKLVADDEKESNERGAIS